MTSDQRELLADSWADIKRYSRAITRLLRIEPESVLQIRAPSAEEAIGAVRDRKHALVDRSTGAGVDRSCLPYHGIMIGEHGEPSRSKILRGDD